MIEHTADIWPRSASLEELIDICKQVDPSADKSIVDDAVRIGSIIASSSGYFSNNDLLAWTRDVIRCHTCGEVFPLRKWFRWGIGTEDVFFLYCDSDSTLVLFGVDDLPSKLKGLSPKCIDDECRQSIEENLKPCPCGGKFRFNAELLCPKCNNVIRNGHQRGNLFYVIEEYLDGGEDHIWK